MTEFEELLGSWQEGIVHFNERRFWEAHEAWERGWLTLPPERKLHIQALIQAAAVFHLLGLGRTDPARALAKRSLEKFAKLSEQGGAPFPRIDVPGLENALAEVASSRISGHGLKAELLLSPRS